ncbi:MAG: M48 family metalloprotease [Pseudomonadota bacterium]
MNVPRMSTPRIATPRTGRRGRWLPALLLGLAAAMAAAPAAAQFGNLLNNLGGGGASSGAAVLGNLLGGGQAGKAAPAGGGDLLQLLGQSTQEIDTPHEIEIGRQLVAVLLGTKPLVADVALQQYVNRLGRWIALQSPRPDLPWTFIVLDDPGFNAFAAPGGYVLVTRGLIDRTRDEAELAGVLAHEISHVTQKHHLQAVRKSAQMGLAAQLVASQINTDRAGGFISAQLLALTRNLYSKGLSQDDEFEADRLGVALAARAGFDPYGLPSVVQQLTMVPSSDQLFALTFSTHPAPQARLDRLATAMGQRLDVYAGAPAVSIAQRLGAGGALAVPAAARPGAAPAQQNLVDDPPPPPAGPAGAAGAAGAAGSAAARRKKG